MSYLAIQYRSGQLVQSADGHLWCGRELAWARWRRDYEPLGSVLPADNMFHHAPSTKRLKCLVRVWKPGAGMGAAEDVAR